MSFRSLYSYFKYFTFSKGALTERSDHLIIPGEFL